MGDKKTKVVQAVAKKDVDSGLQTILEQLAKNDKFLAQDPAAYPAATRSGLESRRRTTEEAQVETLGQLAHYLKNNAKTIVVIGDGASYLKDVAETTTDDVIAVTADRPYKEIASSLWKTLGNRGGTFGIDQYAGLIELVNGRYVDLGKDRPYLDPKSATQFAIDSESSMVNVVRRVVRDMVKDELAGEVLAGALMRGFRKHDLSKSIPTAVVVGVASRDEAEGLRTYWPFSEVVSN